jgi:hypothetical protein
MWRLDKKSKQLMNEKLAMEIVESTELTTAQWTALKWYFKQKGKKAK